MTTTAARAALRVVAGAAATRAAHGRIERAAPASGTGARWMRRNYRGRSVSLLGGAAVAVGALGSVVLDGTTDRRIREAAFVAGGVAAIAGALDDLSESASARGFRGHVGALRHRRVTTGAVKLAAIGSAGLAAGWRLADGGVSRRLAAGTVVAACANLANLLDLRPARALKATLVIATPLAFARQPGSSVAAAAGGAAAGLFADDLRERTMLGDVGANCLGALLGVALVAGASTRRVAASLAVSVGLTIVSEVVSFSDVIEATPVLQWLDRLGRLAETDDA